MAESKDDNFQDLNSPKANNYTKGLIKDYNDSYVPEGVWTNAINAVNNSHMGDMYTIGNEPSNKYCTQSVFEVIGVIRVDATRWAIFSTNDIASEIGLFNESDCSYKRIVLSSCLNFEKAHLITGATQRNYDCSFTVFFADGFNPDKAIKFDPDDPNFVNQNFAVPFKYIPYIIAGYNNPNSDCPIPYYDSPPRLDCDRLRLQYLITVPCFTLEKSNSAGTLFNGTYQVTIAYTINNQRVTDYFALSNAAAVWSHENNGNSLDLVLTAIDTNFDEYEVVLISTVAERTTARRIGFYSTTQTTVHIDDNTDALVTIPLEDIPINRPVYDVSDGMYSLNYYLLRSGVKTKPEFNYQPLANQIVAKWVQVQYSDDYYIKGNNNTGYMRDEVYSFFIRWVYNTGDKTASYHIPGRPIKLVGQNPDNSIVSGPDVLSYDAYTKILYRGYASSGTNTTLTDNGSTWTVNQWVNYKVRIVGGTGVGQTNNIASNTASVLTVSPNWTVIPDATSVYNIIATTAPGTAYRWKVFNTAITTSSPGGILPDGGVVVAAGYMGYWESTENYPTKPEVWNSSFYSWSQITSSPYPWSSAPYSDYDLCGTSIRHHKFPEDTIAPIFNNTNKSIQILGVRFENIRNPVDQQGNPIKGIVGYEILRGSREGNKTIIAKGLMSNMWEYADPAVPASKILYQNYPFNSLQPDLFLRKNAWYVPATSSAHDDTGLPATSYKQNYFTFHSPELTFRGAYLNPTEVKIYREYQGTATGSFVQPFGHPKQKIPSYGAFLGAMLLGLGLTIQGFTGKKSTVAGNIADPVTLAANTATGAVGTVGGVAAAAGAIATGATGWNGGTVLGFANGFWTGLNLPTIQTEDTGLSTLNPIGKKGSFISQLISYLQQISMFVSVGGYYLAQNFGNIYKAFKELLPWVQYARQYNGVGVYDKAVGPTPNNTRRIINKARYISDSAQQFDPNYVINNINRPKSVVISTQGVFADPILQDQSRQTIYQLGIWNNPGNTTRKPISAYYGGLKIDNPSQYNQLGSIAQVPIGTCVQPKSSSPNGKAISQIYFGGDVYINRYTELNKFSFFTNWLFDQPNGTEFNYRQYANIPYPRYWANFEEFDLNDVKLLPGFPTFSSGFSLNALISFIGRLVTTFGQFIFNPAQALQNLVGGPSNFQHLDRDPSSYNASLGNLFKFNFYIKNAYFYLFSNGVKDFFCESEINLACRDYGEQISEQFYNPYGYSNIYNLFRTDLITVPEFYKYDFSMSAGRLLSTYISWGSVLPVGYDPDNQACFEYFPNRLIYSLQQQFEQSRDNWRIYLANNYKDFENQINNVKSINRTGAIILFEDAIPTTINGVDELRTSAGNRITVGDGGLFNQPFQNLVNADVELEYGSCQSERSVINTPYGVFWISQRNGKVMHLFNNQISDISMNGMRFWFAENLPYTLLLSYPNFPHTDNPVKGVGCQAVYDNQYEIVYFMKRDFKKNPGITINYDPDIDQFIVNGYSYTIHLTYGTSAGVDIKNLYKIIGKVNNQTITACTYIGNITTFVDCLVTQIEACPNIKVVYKNVTAYDFTLSIFLDNDTLPATFDLYVDETMGELVVPFVPIDVVESTERVVSLSDPNYFEDCSWTVSYDPKIKAWISFHDWHPDLTFPSNDHFFTIVDNTFWKHNDRCDSFGNFYNINYGWEVEFPVNTQTTVTTIKSVEYYLEVLRYNINCSDRYHVLDANFDEAILYNTEQISGLLKLNSKPKGNPAALLTYPKVNLNSIDILVAKEENKYRFNQFWDTARDRGEFSGLQITNFITQCNGYRMDINPVAVNYQKSPLERKKFRHYGNRVILRKTKSGPEKMNLKVVITKETLSPR